MRALTDSFNLLALKSAGDFVGRVLAKLRRRT